MTNRSLMSGLLMVALLGCGPGEDAGEGAEAPIRAVRTALAVPVEPVRHRAFPAVLEPPQITPLAFEVGGRLGALEPRIGERVAAGEVVASVEPQDFDTEERRAEAALAEAEIAA